MAFKSGESWIMVWSRSGFFARDQGMNRRAHTRRTAGAQSARAGSHARRAARNVSDRAIRRNSSASRPSSGKPRHRNLRA